MLIQTFFVQVFRIPFKKSRPQSESCHQHTGEKREANLPEAEFDVRRDVLGVTSLADCTVQSSPVGGELSSSSQSAEQCEEVRRRGETRLGLDPRAVPGDR